MVSNTITEMGSKEMTLREVRQLGVGSVITLERLAGNGLMVPQLLIFTINTSVVAKMVPLRWPMSARQPERKCEDLPLSQEEALGDVESPVRHRMAGFPRRNEEQADRPAPEEQAAHSAPEERMPAGLPADSIAAALAAYAAAAAGHHHR